MTTINTATLTLYCKDAPGIVAHISNFIFERGGNIITSNHHFEELNNQFFMRVHFDTNKLKITDEQFKTDLAATAANYKMKTALSFSSHRKKLAVMVSKYDHCLYDLLLRHQYGEINADLALIVSNHRDLEHVAKAFKIPFFYVPVTKDTKEEAEGKQIEIFAQHNIDFVAMARYMQILSPKILEAYSYRIINVHHGFLPAFKGARPYHQAYEGGVKIIGATSHYATAELDMGPIIDQETLRVNHTHSVQAMLAMGRDVEKQVLANAIKAYADDRIIVYKNRTIVFPE